MFSKTNLWPNLKSGTRVLVKVKAPGGKFNWEPGTKTEEHFVQLDRGPVSGYPKENSWKLLGV
mgnify:CR=1 FL=1